MSIPDYEATGSTREPTSTGQNDSSSPSEGNGSTTPPADAKPIPAPKYGAYAPGWEPGGVHAVAAEREKAAREARRAAQEARGREGDVGAGINTSRFGAPAHDAMPPEQRGAYPPAGARPYLGTPAGGPGPRQHPGGPYPGGPGPYGPGPYGPGPYGPGPYGPGPYGPRRPQLMPPPPDGTPGYPSTKPAIRTIIAGLIVMLAVPLFIWLATLFGFGSLVGGKTLVTYQVKSGVEFTLKSSQMYVIKSPDAPLGNHNTDCTLLQDGQAVDLWKRPGIEESIHNPGFYFEGKGGSTYVAECSVDDEPISQLEVTNQEYLFAFMDNLKPVGIGVLVGFIGFVVCIVALINLARVHSKQRKFRMDPRNYPELTNGPDRPNHPGPGPSQGRP